MITYALENSFLTLHQTQDARIRGRLYPTVGSKASQVLVTSRQDPINFPHTRYPFAESHLDHSRIQPAVHNCAITIHEGPHLYRYMIFFKNHCRLPFNASLASLSQGQVRSVLRGDILVMRVGTNYNYVNMRERDTILTDWFMKRYALVLFAAL